VPALHEVNLELAQGDRLLLLGPNGAGKSTFIRVFAGLMHPSGGGALVLDRPAHAARAAVGVVSHTPLLYEELTASENLRLYAELYGIEQPRQRSADVLEQVGMTPVADERVGRLSRGQQQRVAIARAVLHDPPVLLLDEPDTGLDVAAFALLEALITGADRTIVLTTHNVEAGARLATRAAVLSRGQLVHQRGCNSATDVADLGELLQRLAAA
jgi:heme exporter protein A